MRISQFYRDPAFRPIIFAYATTGLSKVATILVQIVALPLVASAVGADRFGAMLAIAALFSLVSTAGIGIAPVASQGIADRLGADDKTGAIVRFWTQFAMGGGIALVVLAASVLAAWLIDPVTLLGREVAPFASSVRLAMVAAGLHMLFFYAFGFIDGVRAAHAQNHITNIYTFSASSLILLGTAVAVWFEVRSLFVYYVLLFAVPPMMQGANLVAFLIRYREHFQHVRIARGDMGDIAHKLIAYMQTQIGLSLHLHAPVYFAARFIGLDASALMGAVARLFALTHSAIWSMATPVLPLMSSALAAGRRRRARIISALSTGGFLGITGIIGLSFAVGGAWLMLLWLGLSAEQPKQFFPFAGLFFVLFSGLHMSYVILLAAGRVGLTQSFLLASGVTAVAITLFFGAGLSLPELVALNCTCMALVAIPAMALQMLRFLRAASEG